MIANAGQKLVDIFKLNLDQSVVNFVAPRRFWRETGGEMNTRYWDLCSEDLPGPTVVRILSNSDCSPLHSHVRLFQMQASEFVACEQALVLGSAGQGRRRSR
jgi:hypothetical protein